MTNEELKRRGLEQAAKAIEFAKAQKCPDCKATLTGLKTEGSAVCDYSHEDWWNHHIGLETKVTYECPNCGTRTFMIH